MSISHFLPLPVDKYFLKMLANQIKAFYIYIRLRIRTLYSIPLKIPVVDFIHHLFYANIESPGTI